MVEENSMTIYEGFSAPVRRYIMRQRVKLELRKVLTSKETPHIKWDVGGSWDVAPTLSGSYDNCFASNTTTAIAPFVISNEGLRALHSLGYDLCHTCSGDGWDANSGGACYICPDCNGKGITKLKETNNGQNR